MELGVFVKHGDKPLPEANLILHAKKFAIHKPGPAPRFTKLDPGIYTIDARAEGYYEQSLTIGLEKSTKLDIELKERR